MVKRVQHAADTQTPPEAFLVQGVSISKPDRVLYPQSDLTDSDITKGAVAEYYSAISPRMLPYLQDRLLATFRCPDGIGVLCFFRKHATNAEEGTGILSVREASGATGTYVYVKDVTGLLSEVQMYTLEFHIWGSHINTLEQPDLLVFDFDPDPGMELVQVRQGVKDLKTCLDDLALRSYLKTTGGKGYHLVVPLRPQASWETLQSFAKKMAERMEARWPERYTNSSRKNARHGRIYIDWERNVRGATAVCPYSLRARERATVSLPIAWDELDFIAPDGITLQTALARLDDEDPWRNFFVISQELPKS
ncbi:MAG: non-homologous end-joining DNA ligase [Coriobacteriales bacterium]|jgi:bifunctional non-homologous end joining protein LigD|nr:non-homologous end-joining DNA ligase [Coriobacteriales bacterium]